MAIKAAGLTRPTVVMEIYSSHLSNDTQAHSDIHRWSVHRYRVSTTTLRYITTQPHYQGQDEKIITHCKSVPSLLLLKPSITCSSPVAYRI